jgi:hypothetical protein
VEVDVSAGANQRGEPPPWSGPWADDAHRLFQLVQTVVAQAEAAARTPAGSASSEHPPECRYCPLCQGIGLLRRAGPDVLDQVSDFATGLAATLRAAQPPEPGAPSDSGSGSGSDSDSDSGGERAADSPSGPSFDRSEDAESAGPARPARPPRTVRIDITD